MNTEHIARVLGPRKKDSSNLPRNPRNRGGNTQQTTDEIAEYLVQKFDSPDYRNLFLKVAWRLDRGTIDRFVTAAFELATTNKRAYFISLVKKEPKYNEVR